MYAAQGSRYVCRKMRKGELARARRGVRAQDLPRVVPPLEAHAAQERVSTSHSPIGLVFLFQGQLYFLYFFTPCIFRPSDRRLSAKLMPSFADREMARSQHGGSPMSVI
jgi:hypothetical protein